MRLRRVLTLSLVAVSVAGCMQHRRPRAVAVPVARPAPSPSGLRVPLALPGFGLSRRAVAVAPPPSARLAVSAPVPVPVPLPVPVARVAAAPVLAAPVAVAPAVVAPALAYVAAPAVAVAEPVYTLDSGDRLRVVVFGQEGLSNSYAVDASGAITMPLIGAVRARGRTTAELSADIAARLRRNYIREPHVAVEVELHRPFFILGEVTAPGQYPFVAQMTAEKAVAIAGGYTPRAWKYEFKVTRMRGGQLSAGKVPPTYPLQPGDTLHVAERWF